MIQNSFKIQGKFYRLTPKLAKTPRVAKLADALWRFWAYLVKINPLSNDYASYSRSVSLAQPKVKKRRHRYLNLNQLTIQTESGFGITVTVEED